eukprot:308507-Amphidinium_carterae.1
MTLHREQGGDCTSMSLLYACPCLRAIFGAHVLQQSQQRRDSGEGAQACRSFSTQVVVHSRVTSALGSEAGTPLSRAIMSSSTPGNQALPLRTECDPTAVANLKTTHSVHAYYLAFWGW